MDWKVFKRDNPDTWPQIDCKFLVCGDNDVLAVCEWDKTLKCFYDEHGFTEYWECFYATIGYLPYIEKECHTAKCKGGKHLCSEYDDGYCIGDDLVCKCMEVATEYAIGHKRIWKEF